MTTTPEVEKDVDLIPSTPGEVAKALVYIALSAIGILIAALGDNFLSAVEIVQLVIVVAGAVPVYLIAGTVPKTIAAFIVAGAQAILLVLVDVTNFADISTVSWLVVIVAAFAGIGVAIVPNGSRHGPLAVVPTPTPISARAVQDQIDVQDQAARHRPITGDHPIIG